MALADQAELLVRLTLAGNFTQQLKSSQRALGSFDASLAKTEGRAFRAGQQIGTGIKNAAKIATVGLAALFSQVGFGLKSLADLESAQAQTNAVIESTGGIAGISAKDVRRLAEQYENLNATMDDKVIQSGENLLLTFTNIRKEAFEPALEAALNMSTALDQDLNTSVLQLGKALSNPVKGITALTRAGVVFTDQQKDQIKALVKSGDLLGAQKIILGELGKEFGGSFAAQGKTAEGALAGIGDAVEDLQKALATALFPTIQKVLPRIREFLTSPELTRGAEELGETIAGWFSEENITAGANVMKDLLNVAKEAAPTIAAAAKVTAEVVKTAVTLFRSLPPEIQSLAIGAFAVNKLTGGLVTNLASGLIGGVLKQLVSGVVNVRGATVVVTGGAGGAPVGGAAGGGGKVAGLVNGAMKVFMIGAAAGIFAELLGNRNEQAAANQAQAAGVAQQATVYIAGANVNDLKNNLKGLLERTNYLTSNLTPEAIAYQLDIDGVRTTTERVISQLQAQITTLEGQAAARQNVTNERAEAIKAQVQAAAARATADSFSERSAIDRVKADVQRQTSQSITDSASERSTVRSAAATQLAETARVKEAARTTAAAIRDKDLSVTNNISVPVRVSVSARETIKMQTTFKQFYKTNS